MRQGRCVVRDIDQMIDLLEEMANDPDGFILVTKALNMSSVQRMKLHHVELLIRKWRQLFRCLRISPGLWPCARQRTRKASR